jgi:fatty acid CoA ligase FadD36
MRLLPGLTGPLADHPGAVQVAGRAASAQDLLSAAAAVAGRIAGAPAVAVHATASLETVAAVVGGLLAGVPVVPIAPDSGVGEVAHLLADSGAAMLLAAASAGDVWPDRGIPLVPVDAAERGDYRGDADGSAGGGSAGGGGDDETALILYTSGTTGRPKGVPVTRAAIAADLDALAEAWAWTAGDTLVHGLPLFHVHGLVLGLLGPLRVGSRLVHTGRPTPEEYARAAGSLYFGVPTVWSRVSADPAAARALSGARLLVSGSAALPGPVFARLVELTGLRPAERYGMTETLITVAARADDPDRRAGIVGRPIAGVQTRLIGPDGGPAPHDGSTVGELQIRGATVFAGYLNRPDATADSFTADGWFRTGDMAVLSRDGAHRIVGRAATDLIKSGGYRIGAGEIEDALLGRPGVTEAAVIGVPDEDLGERIVAYVVATGVTERELIDAVAGDLSVHKRPREVVFVDALPRNAMGKVRKDQLR